MSGFWNKMNIIKSGIKMKRELSVKREKDETQSLFLKNNVPEILDKGNYIIKHGKDNDFKKLSEFYCYFYKISKTDYIINVLKEDLDKYYEMGSEIICLYESQDQKLLGSIISFPIPVHINSSLSYDFIEEKERIKKIKCDKKDFVIACASYLILHKNYRSKGLGMLMAQESFKVLHDNGGRAAYFINRASRCDNSILVPVWYYPINLKTLQECKYPYPNLYNFDLTSTNRIVNCNENVNLQQESYKYYISCIENKTFTFSPNYEYFLRWIHTFPSFLIYENEKITGFFSLNTINCYYSIYQKTIKESYVILSVNCEIKDIVKLCRDAKICDIVKFYGVGDLTNEKFKKAFCQPCSSVFINFYNLNLFLSSGDFFAPII